MADARRIDERIEFSLSSRSAVALVAGGGLVLVLVFALGVMLGRQLARPPTAVRPITQAEARTDEKKDDEEVSFTFHERLVYEPDSPLRKAAKPRDPPPQPPAPQQPAARPASAKAKPEVVVVRGDDLEPAVEAMAARQSPEPDVRGEEGREPEGREPEGSAEDERALAPVAAAERDVGRADVAVETPPSSAATPPAPTPAPADETRWSVQFGAAPNREDADRLLEQLRSNGVPAYIVEVDLPEKGRFFRVRAGRFADRSAADRLLEEARASGFDGLVMR